MLGKCKGKQVCRHVSDYVLFDLETTGISTNYDEIIEISAVKVRNGEIVEEFDELVNPGRSIPIQATMVNNITNAMVAKAPSFQEILPRFLEFAGDDVLVGHNIGKFDLMFIYRDCERMLGALPDNDYIDTLQLATLIFPDWKHRKLGDLAEFYSISTEGAHRALNDCVMNQKVFEMLGKELDGRGKLEVKPDIRVCPDCGKPMKKRSGKFGDFFGCSGYPNCKHTERIL